MSDVRCCPWCGHAIGATDAVRVIGHDVMHDGPTRWCADEYATGERIAAHHAQETTRR